MFIEKNENPDLSQQNKIGLGTTLTGDVNSENDFRIDGKLIGNLTIQGTVFIGKSGYIEGDIICQNAEVEGSFEGILKASKSLNLKSSAQISGEIITDKLTVADGATFNATCQMSEGFKKYGRWHRIKTKAKKFKSQLMAG